MTVSKQRSTHNSSCHGNILRETQTRAMSAARLISALALPLLLSLSYSADGLTAVQITCSGTECDSPTARGVWRLDPPADFEPKDQINPKSPEKGKLLGVIIQKVTISYDLCECSVIDDPNLGKFINLTGCQGYSSTHYEMHVVRENEKTRTDRLTLVGTPPAHEATIDAIPMFIPWDAPGYSTIVGDAGWKANDKGQADVLSNPQNSLPPGADGVNVGESHWRTTTPSGWDDEFGGQAITGGDHSLSLLWVCCEGCNSSAHECNP
jgi:hypothetical protein